MYKIQLDKAQQEAVRRGDTQVILALLKRSDETIIKELKLGKGNDLAFLQGASHIIDRLIKLLEA